MPISQQQSQELDTLVKITEILTGPLQFLDKCESVLAVLAEFTGSELVILRELDAENYTLNPVASYNRLTPPDLPLSPSLPDKALDLRIPVVVNDYLALETRDQGYVKAGVKSALIIPVEVDGEVLGTLGFASKSLNHYQEDTVRVLVAIGAVVAMMLAKAELQEDNEVDANIGRIVSSPLVGPDVFGRFAAEAARIIEFDRLALNSVNVEENTYITEFLFGEKVLNFPIGDIQKIDRTALEIVIQTKAGRRFLLDERDGIGPKFPHADSFVASGQRYLIGVPLIVGDHVIGTMGFNRGSRQFSHKDLTKAERLANLVAGAFADFKLQEYKVQVERKINKNRAILEAEAAIGRILSSPLNRAGASETLISEIDNIIPLDHVVIAAIDIETETFSSDFNEFLGDPILTLTDKLGLSYAGSITGEIARTGKGQIVNFDDPRLKSGQLPMSQRAFDQGYRSILIVPLKYEGIIIGTLILLSRREREYSNEDMVTADRIGNLLSGALATFKITTERNRAQSALAESDNRFRQIADSIHGVFWLAELDPHRLIYASSNFEDVWDVPLTDAYNGFVEWFKRIHPEDRPSIEQASARAAQTGELDIECRIIKQDGSVRWVHSRGFPIKDSNGNVYRMSGIAEDITDRKMELEKITEAGRLLSIGELASGVAHEINNPLANINLYAEGLLQRDLPDLVIKDLQVILDQGKRASAVVRNLLQFAKKSSPEISTVAARKFVDHCIELASHDFRDNNVSVSTEILLGHPEFTIDQNLMTQVLVNILTNAGQACVSANGQGHISVTVQEVDGSIRISISDDGPGIPPENLKKVFDPFFTTKEIGEGTGLGLSVSYGIIAQLGGKLWVESDGLAGSTFHIELPSVEEVKFSGTTSRGDSPDKETASPLHVLVVDDEPDLRFVLARLVERQGHTTDQAGDGEEAWRKVQNQHYDCILLDLRMAGTDGRKLFQQMSASDPSLAEKVIFVTGDLANAKTRSFLQPLANPVLQKPFSIADVERALAAVAKTGLC